MFYLYKPGAPDTGYRPPGGPPGGPAGVEVSKGKLGRVWRIWLTNFFAKYWYHMVITSLLILPVIYWILFTDLGTSWPIIENKYSLSWYRSLFTSAFSRSKFSLRWRLWEGTGWRKITHLSLGLSRLSPKPTSTEILLHRLVSAE